MIPQVKLNDEIFLDIKRIGINGEGIGYYKKQAIFVPGVLPKENVKVKIVKVNGGYAEGEVVEIKTKSPERCENFCDYYTKCGGCSIQHLNYEASGAMKRDLLMEAITRYTKLNPRSFEVKPTIIMKDPMHYRAKVNMPVRNGIHGVVFGLYAPNSEKFVRIKNCGIQNEVINEVVYEVGKALDKLVIKAYDGKEKKGYVRYLVVRSSVYNKETQVSFILDKKLPLMDELAKEVMKIKNVVSVYYSVNNDDDDPMIFGKDIIKVAGKDSITEKLGDYYYNLLPNSFFQLNPSQAAVLYEEVRKACKLSRKENVLDAFCGVGSIGIYLAKWAKEVVGVESNKQAVENAKENAKLNKLNNIRFIEGNATNVLPYLIKDHFIPDIMVFDPPRTGMTPEIKQAIIKSKPKRIVYVSCNPASLAKDLDTLSEYYTVSYIQPVDMFPFTSLVECVVRLELKK